VVENELDLVMQEFVVVEVIDTEFDVLPVPYIYISIINAAARRENKVFF
jgi:hypothetical protein